MIIYPLFFHSLFLLQKTPHSQGRTEVEFIVRSISGPVVAFESLKFPGHFVSIGKNGLAKVERRGLDSDHVQFTVRINVSVVVCL